MEGEGGFDQGEGGDGGHRDVHRGEGGIEAGQADTVRTIRLPDVLDSRVGVTVGDEREQINLSPKDAVNGQLLLFIHHDVAAFEERSHRLPSYIDRTINRRKVRDPQVVGGFDVMAVEDSHQAGGRVKVI